MPRVDAGAFLDDLYSLRKIGAFKTGVSRPTYGPEDMESRRWLMGRMQTVGLEPSIDGIGNVFGRHRGKGPHVLTGSHIDSQIEAGWLDGALGVVAGVALARAGLPVDVCAFADEEGHFTPSYLGSKSIIGELSEEDLNQSRGRFDGAPLRDALRAAGLADVPRMQIDPSRYKGFFELHIEQGTALERSRKRIGVVSGIVGIWTWQLAFEGQQDHAGGTNMAERRDAGLSAVRLLAAVDQEFPRVCSDRSVWTTTRITLDPGGPGIIPGKADVRFQFRDLSHDVLSRMEDTLFGLVRESNRKERCSASLTSLNHSSPVLSDPTMIAALVGAAQELCPGDWTEMPSAGGHDAKIIAERLPVAMLFVPSIGGISHHWSENTSDEDLVLGAEVLAAGVERYLSAERG